MFGVIDVTWEFANAGARPVGRAIEPDGPAARASTLPCPEIRAALLWTSVPDLMPLPPQVLDEAFARVTPA